MPARPCGRQRAPLLGKSLASEPIFLVIAIGPWIAGIVFVRAVLVAVRKNWRAAANYACAATLVQVPVIIGCVMMTSVHNRPDVSSGDLLMLISASLAVVLSAVSSLLWFVMVAVTLVARPKRPPDPGDPSLRAQLRQMEEILKDSSA